MLSPRDVAFIGCRLVALYFLFLAVPSLVSLILGVLERRSQAGVFVEAATIYQDVYWSAIHVLVFFLLIALVWIKADWLSRRILPDARKTALECLVDPVWNRETVFALVIRIVGLAVVVTYAPQVIGGIYFRHFADVPLGLRWTPYAQYGMPLASLLLGLALLMGLDRVRAVRNRIKAFGALVLDLRRWW